VSVPPVGSELVALAVAEAPEPNALAIATLLVSVAVAAAVPPPVAFDCAVEPRLATELAWPPMFAACHCQNPMSCP
jgi:hypothetical protein